MTNPFPRLTALGSALMFAGLALVWLSSVVGVQAVALTPTLTGETEYCLSCHADVPEISASHPIDTFGCVRCHGGERLALDADLAHSTMRGGRNPSALHVVEESCGGSDCHSGDPANQNDHIQRVMTSIQATYAGAITQMRYTFGAQTSLVAEMGVSAVVDDDGTTNTGITQLHAFDPTAETNPFLQRFGENCLTCHLEGEPPAGAAFLRMTGCAACHTPDVVEGETVHRLTTAIPYTQCNTCHNRGNYDLRTMTFVERADTPEGRLEDYYQPIAEFVRCEWTLDCIDCHPSRESMGDGDIYTFQADIQYVQCKTCHGTASTLPITHTIVSEDDYALRLAFLNPVMTLDVGDTILMTEQGEPLWNTRVLADGTYEMVGKATGQTFPFRAVMGTACEQNEAEQESRYCHECHAVDH